MRQTAFLIFLASIAALVLCDYPLPKSYEINLDADPAHYYDQIIVDFKTDLLVLNDLVNTELMPSYIKFFLNIVYNVVTRLFYSDFFKQIEGVAKAAGISGEDAFAMNCYYEFSVLCTAIVVRDPNGKMLLAKNLDYDYPEILMKLYFTGIYKKGGKTIFTCSEMAGYVGSLTCLKQDAFAITLNARYNDTTMGEAALNFIIGRAPITWTIKRALYHTKTYKELFDIMVESKAVVGGYIAIAGLKRNEGALITRGASGAVDIQAMNDSVWYIAQCNDDHWNMIDEDNRTHAAVDKMNRIGADGVDLFRIAGDVLVQAPNRNEYTIATVLMLPEENYIITYITGGNAEPGATNSYIAKKAAKRALKYIIPKKSLISP